MKCKFSNRRKRNKELVSIAVEEVQQKEQTIFVLIIHNNGKIEEDVKRRFEKQVGLKKWNASGVICNRRRFYLYLHAIYLI